MLGSQTMDE